MNQYYKQIPMQQQSNPNGQTNYLKTLQSGGSTYNNYGSVAHANPQPNYQFSQPQYRFAGGGNQYQAGSQYQTGPTAHVNYAAPGLGPSQVNPGDPGYSFNPERSRQFNQQQLGNPGWNGGGSQPPTWGGGQGPWFQPPAYQPPTYQQPNFPFPYLPPQYAPPQINSGQHFGGPSALVVPPGGFGKPDYQPPVYEPPPPFEATPFDFSQYSAGDGSGGGGAPADGSSGSGSSNNSFDFGAITNFLNSQGLSPFNVSLGPVISQQQQQQILNRVLGNNATQASTQQQAAMNSLTGSGFSAESPALQNQYNRINLNQAIADSQAMSQVPIDVARTNAEYGLTAGNIMNNQFANQIGAYTGFQNSSANWRNSDNNRLATILGFLQGIF